MWGANRTAVLKLAEKLAWRSIASLQNWVINQICAGKNVSGNI